MTIEKSLLWGGLELLLVQYVYYPRLVHLKTTESNRPANFVECFPFLPQREATSSAISPRTTRIGYNSFSLLPIWHWRSGGLVYPSARRSTGGYGLWACWGRVQLGYIVNVNAVSVPSRSSHLVVVSRLW